jgi:aquaporin Z
MEYDPLRRGVAEFIGTFTLIFIGAGSILTIQSVLGVTAPAAALTVYGLVGIALAHGLAIAVMVSAVGHISGGHFNPAVTLAFVVTRRITLGLAGVYLLVQLAGGTLAALLLRAIYSGSVRHAAHLGAPGLGSTSAWRGFLIEAVLTFFLVFVIFATAVDERGTFKSIAGLAIGLTITLDIFMGGPLTGAAMNPARAFGPFVAGREWRHGWWIYFTAPAAGAVVAGLLYELLYLRPLAPKPVGPPESGVLEPRPGDAAAS